MTTLFDHVAQIVLGYKSFLNDFFYVDSQVIQAFKIEPEFVRPIYMLADLDETTYIQTPTPNRWVFHCKREPSDLRGTGAGRYVDWGSQQTTELRKQSREAVPWPKTPALQHLKHWYWPAAPLHPTRLAIRKGVGLRYAPFIFDRPTVLDQRLYLVFPRSDLEHEVLAAYLASSFFPLAVETNADMGLGAGVLTLGTDALRELPVLDLRKLASSPRRKELDAAASALFAQPTVDAEGQATSGYVRALDEAILAANGLREDSAREVAEQVAALAHSRVAKSKLRSVVRQASKSADLSAVAAPIIEELRQWLLPRRFPEDFHKASVTTKLTFPDDDLIVDTEVLLGTSDLTVSTRVSGVIQYHEQLNVHVAEVVVRGLQLGRRDFSIPTDRDTAAATLDALDDFLEGFERQLRKSLGKTGLGSKYDDLIERLVLRGLHVQMYDLRQPLATGRLVIWSTR